MRETWEYPFIVAVLLCSFSAAQMSTLPAAKAIAELPGPPKNPPIFSEMTVIMQSGLAFDDTMQVKGTVVEVQRVDQLPLSRNSSQRRRTTRFKFDDNNRLIQQIDGDDLSTTTKTNVFQNGRQQSQTVDYRSKNHGEWQEWQRWSYDERGRLTDFRAGRDKIEWNHYLNFKYDAEGRPLAYEYHDSKVGGPPVFTEIVYSGKTVTMNRLDGSRHKFFEQTQVLDDNSRVVDLKVSDLAEAQLKLWYHVRFKYDDKGRIIEQNTDPFKLGSGDDYSPLPGRLVVEYSDDKHLGEQRFFDVDGKLALHTKFGFDRDGNVTKLRVLDRFGKERTGEETLFDAASEKAITRSGNAEWEALYDDHGNWTERRRWFTPADGSPRIMTRLMQQNITYR